MSRTLVGMFAALALVAAVAHATPAQAQISYSAPTVVYRPVVPAYVQPTTYVQPTAYLQPTTVCYGGAPVVAAPAPVVVNRAWTPVPVTTTRFRPILGGTVTRTRVYYAPTTVVAPAW